MIEILQGPNDDNEIIEIETDNASVHPFYTVIQTPGKSEFALFCCVLWCVQYGDS